MTSVSTTHQCFVCGDTIELTAQVCSRYCMRALEQMTVLDSLDSLEAQVESPKHSDYEIPTAFKIVPDQPEPAVLVDSTPLYVTPPHKSY